MKLIQLAGSLLVALAAATAPAFAANVTKLRMQTHYGPETVSGKMAKQFIDDVQVMSGGRIEIEMFWSSSVVKSVEGFDAAASGILDGEMHGAAYLTGKNPAFQFIGDPMGAYDTPWQQYAWLYHGGGFDKANKLYHKYGMELIGWWLPGPESLVSSKALRSPADLKDWKFRSPPGLETEIFANLGSKPIVMDFTEVFTAIETKIIDGADASALANNKAQGLYDLAKHATFPGFHSMPSDHVTIRKDIWDGMPKDLQRIITVAAHKLGFQNTMLFEVLNNDAAAALKAGGVTMHAWSNDDRITFRKAALKAWDGWAAKTPEAKELAESHREFQKRMGLID